MNRRSWSLNFLVFLLGSLVIVSSFYTVKVHANCEVSPCSKGYVWRNGGCNSGRAPGYQSHTIPRCPAGYSLNRTRGVCQKPGCVNCEKPACNSRERYRLGSCHSGRAPGYQSHRIATCPSGWRLIRARGVCRRNNCPRVVLPRPVPTPFPRPLPRFKPDLVVTELAAINYGRTCSISRPITIFRVKVTNRGLLTSPSLSGRVRLHVFDRHYRRWGVTTAVGVLRRGQTKTYYLRLPYLRIAPAHMSNTLSHPFVAVVDSTNRVSESNERNNTSRVRLLGRPAACR